ncbi:hypothetical protein EYF80_031997 [Liparis tanakae]|uniref:Uncharacterized protein n=1 Tax=Liparis tanakae TaxID=230148 RepID=A0A4Z2GYG4_9TELE|nr:hypothetical protein EYF80_031997 [Liparis tanakae]
MKEREMEREREGEGEGVGWSQRLSCMCRHPIAASHHFLSPQHPTQTDLAFHYLNGIGSDHAVFCDNAYLPAVKHFHLNCSHFLAESAGGQLVKGSLRPERSKECWIRGSVGNVSLR